MLNRTYTVIAVMAAISLLLVSVVFGAPTGGQVSEGAQDTGSGTASQTVTTEGGNVTEVNISGTSITGRWAGFYGNVTGGLELSDSSANVFYSWTVADVTGSIVYAANETMSDWTDANIVAATNAQTPTFVSGSATDNFTNTFNYTGQFNSSSITAAGAAYTFTWESGAEGTNFRTYALRGNNDDATLWAAKAVDDTTGFTSSGSLDYQLLAPADSSGATFNFYLELP